ncbi:hypothetical protein [Alcanivorax sp. 24]|uniref:hypothetical protein n=1 Tax=Alcanivorax sp. 24 TaxID=2545266 RepID=UPI00105C9686|nr:hypothetical protein [Alcanivorax sp. 24]
MQFEMTLTVLGINRMNIEGRTFCSVHTGQMPVGDAANDCRGYEVTKMGAEPAVFDQIAADFQPGEDVHFIAQLKKAGGGKSQPYLIGVVPKTTPPASQATKNTGTAKADSK